MLIEELAYDFCRRQWEQNVLYTEVRHCPHLLIRDNKVEKSGSFHVENETKDETSQRESHEQRKQAAREVLRAITNGLRRGCQDYNIIVNQVLCAINWRPD
jgi:adenosine deaminase